MSKRQAGIAAFLLLLPAVALAGTSGWTKVVQINQGTGNNPIIILEDVGAAGDEPGCPSADNRVAFPDISQTAGGERMFTLVLTALTAGQEVQIAVSGCQSARPMINLVRIR